MKKKTTPKPETKTMNPLIVGFLQGLSLPGVEMNALELEIEYLTAKLERLKSYRNPEVVISFRPMNPKDLRKESAGYTCPRCLTWHPLHCGKCDWQKP